MTQDITPEMRQKAQELLGINIDSATDAEIWEALKGDYAGHIDDDIDDDDYPFGVSISDDDAFDEMLNDETDVDVELYLKPTHEFPTGLVVELQPVAPMAVEYLQSNEVGKPEPPTLYNGKHRPPVPEKIRENDNGEDEAYYDYADTVWIQAYEAWLSAHKHRIKMKKEKVLDHPVFMQELREWQAEKQRKLVRYLSIKGVKTNPPQDFIDESAMYMPSDSSLNDFKYMWIMEQLPDEDSITEFYEAVASITMPTQDGIKEVKKS